MTAPMTRIITTSILLLFVLTLGKGFPELSKVPPEVDNEISSGGEQATYPGGFLIVWPPGVWIPLPGVPVPAPPPPPTQDSSSSSSPPGPTTTTPFDPTPIQRIKVWKA